MTPEGVNWWNSLPTDEKRVRRDIADCKTAIKNCKASLNSSAGYSGFEKCSIRYHKKSIRALRRQISLSPILVRISNLDFVCCPKCKHEVGEPCCEQCGQKLRW